MPFEAANIVRRHELDKRISADQAAQAHADLLVALAELLDVALVTLDRAIGREPAPRCSVATP